jgi:acetyltransferase-like isoleucine patch superfamily enzyme
MKIYYKKSEMKQQKSHDAVTSSGSFLSKYQDVVVGNRSIIKTIYFELCTWMSKFPGAVGLTLRKIFWPRLFASCGKGVFFGENIILRHPNRVHLGNKVVISDGCILDARNENSVNVIQIGDNVILSNNVMISCKGGTVKVGSNTGLGAQMIIQSVFNSHVEIGNDVFIGPMCYITGGGNYNTERLDIPIWRQGLKEMGDTVLGNDIWLGANVTILGEVEIGSGSIIAAGAVVSKSVPGKSVCIGVPAKIVKTRSE